jgi:hypothetical protein
MIYHDLKGVIIMANSNRTISDNQIQVNEKVYVQGRIEFARIAKIITGEELQNGDKRRMSMGMQPVGRDHTSITIVDPQIRPKNANGVLTPTEKYVAERFYRKSSDANGPMRYNIINKSPKLPDVYQTIPGNPTQASRVKLNGHEPAPGLLVTLILNIFESQTYHKKGIGLQNVLIQEPIRFFTPTNAANNLAAMGITLNEDEIDIEDNTPGAIIDNGDAVPDFGGNAPYSQVSAPAGSPFSNTPTPAQAPVQAPEMNEPNGWICPSCGATVPSDMKFCGNCGTKKPGQEVANPYANNAAPQASGIRYNPDDNNRDYR